MRLCALAYFGFCFFFPSRLFSVFRFLCVLATCLVCLFSCGGVPVIFSTSAGLRFIGGAPVHPMCCLSSLVWGFSGVLSCVGVCCRWSTLHVRPNYSNALKERGGTILMLASVVSRIFGISILVVCTSF